MGAFLLFSVFFVCLMILGFRLAKLDKGSMIMGCAFNLGGFLMITFTIYLILKQPPVSVIALVVGILMGVEFFTLMFGNYCLKKQTIRKIRLLLCFDIAFLLFFDIYYINHGQDLDSTWTSIIFIVELSLVLWNINILRFLRGMSHYSFVVIHEKRFPVFNEIQITSGFDEENFLQFTIPLYGNVNIEENSFITLNIDDDNVYCITVDNNSHEVRKDKPIILEKDGDITFVTIRVNQTPLANKGDCKEILL
jgi:hypothetical protein